MVKDSPYNRRITPKTEMALTGPRGRHDLLKTEADPTGATSLGTWNNCGNGVTPWGTYLDLRRELQRLLLHPSETLQDQNLELSPEFDETLRHQRPRTGATAGPRSTSASTSPSIPMNRTAPATSSRSTRPIRPRRRKSAPLLGRFKHENAEAVVNKDGRVVVYMGDDERGEFLYRYVSERRLRARRAPTDDLLSERRALCRQVQRQTAPASGSR